MFRRIRIFAAVFSLLILAAAAVAQGTTGNLTGTVTDPNGAVVPGASVKVTNSATNISRESTTDSDGNFAFQALQPGRYRVEVTAANFAAYAVDEDVNITQTTAIDAKLSVGGVGGDVTVDYQAPVIQPETSQQGRVVTGETLRQLPLPTRNFQQLLTLSPGAQADISNTTELGRGDATISVNGQRRTSNNVRINGIDANSIGTNSTPNIAVPAPDSLQEFIVQTSLYDASNGRNAGGNVEAITRSGSNQFRGNVYYFLRDDRFNANDPFAKARGLDRPVLERDQFGGTLGGPIVKDRVFFFFSYQGTREENGASLANSLTFPVVPAGLTDTNRTAAGLSAAFGVPQALITPSSILLLNQRLPNGEFVIPSSGATGFSATTGVPIVQSGVSTFEEDQFNFNGDVNFTENHSLSAKFFIANNPTKQANYNFTGTGNGPQQLLGFGADLDIKQKLYSVADTYVFSPNVVNQARVGFSRIRVTSFPDEPFTAAEVGITNPLASTYPGAPTLSFAGSDSQFFLGSSPLADQSSRINAYTVNDTLSWTAGEHRLKFGGEYRFSQVKFYFNAFTRGQIIYTDTAANIFAPARTPFQNFLAGVGTSLYGSGVFDRYYKVTDWSGFVQDDWKVNNRLTLNLGLRYDLYGLPAEDQGRLVNFIPSQAAVGTGASPAAPPNGFVQAEGGPLAGVPTVEKTLVPVDKNNFAPRVGFAFDMFGDQSVIVRGGYGWYYDRISTRYANTQLFNAPYFALGVGVVNNLFGGAAGTRTAANPFIPLPPSSNFPVAPTIPSPLWLSTPFVGVPIAGVWVDPELQTPYIQQYNLGVQIGLPNNFVAEFGFVGNRGTHLLQVITLNQPIYSGPTGTTVTYPLGAPVPHPVGGTAAFIFSPNKNLTGGMQQVQTTGVSSYKSIQASLAKRFSNGTQFLAAYTGGEATDYYSGGNVNELINVAGDQYNWRLNRGPAEFNRKHRLVISGAYDLPKFVDNSNAAKWLVNDWQIAGIAVFQSGLPFTIVDSNGTTIISRANFNTNYNSSEFYTAGGVSDRTLRYFETSAFVTSRPGTATFDPNAPFGNTPRNFLFGPGQKNVDVSFIKFLPFSDRFRGELRAEVFNAFNWVNYANPGSTIGTATFGRITSASAGPRVVQFAAKLHF